MTGDRDTAAERVRQACIRAALEAYESAGMSGLCEEGRWEAAVDAMRRLDLARLDVPAENGR
jgi:pentatricopeptide repeat protein